METYRLILLLSGLLIAGVFLVWIVRLFWNDTTPPYVPPNICHSPDCVGKSVSCNIANPKTITPCTPQYDSKGNENDPTCYACYGDMTCQKISEKSYVLNVPDLPNGKCEDPYVLENPNDPNSKCYMPAGQFCIPFGVVDIQCNEFTGRKVLAKPSEHAAYQWMCLCKDDTKFTNDGNPEANCDRIRVCGMNGSTNKDSHSRHLVNKNNPNDYWTADSLWDPLTDGACICGSGEVTSQTLPLTCVPNACAPGGKPGADPQSCYCSEGYLDCKTMSTRGDFYDGACPLPSCIPDPCYPGTYAGGNGGCNCPVDKGYTSVPSATSVTGELCVNWCQTSGNDCAGRGDCVVHTEPGADADAVFKFSFISEGQYSGTWTISQKDLFWVVSNGTIILTSSGANADPTASLFTIIQDCAPSEKQCEVQKEPLVPRVKYRLATFDQKHYVSVSSTDGFTIVDTVDDAPACLYDPDLDDKKQPIENQGKLLVESIFYIKVANIEGNYKLSLGTSLANGPSCTNCKAPSAQGPKNRCEATCILNGQDYNTYMGEHCCGCDCNDETCTQGSGGWEGEISIYSAVTGCPQIGPWSC